MLEDEKSGLGAGSTVCYSKSRVQNEVEEGLYGEDCRRNIG